MLAHDFLALVVGETGLRALKKASQRSPTLESVIIPRAIVAWLKIAGQVNYQGSIPGLTNSLIKCSKLFSGRLQNIDYEFKETNLLHTAAAIGVALGADTIPDIDPMIKNELVGNIGQDIDLLVKARFMAGRTNGR